MVLTDFPVSSDSQNFKEVRKCRDSHLHSDATDMWLTMLLSCHRFRVLLSRDALRGSVLNEVIATWATLVGIPQRLEMTLPVVLKAARPPPIQDKAAGEPSNNKSESFCSCISIPAQSKPRTETLTAVAQFTPSLTLSSGSANHGWILYLCMDAAAAASIRLL